jgi:hypothetical protein
VFLHFGNSQPGLATLSTIIGTDIPNTSDGRHCVRRWQKTRIGDGTAAALRASAPAASRAVLVYHFRAAGHAAGAFKTAATRRSLFSRNPAVPVCSPHLPGRRTSGTVADCSWVKGCLNYHSVKDLKAIRWGVKGINNEAKNHSICVFSNK